jgi:membrane protease YdiL (CAAX protease family)
MGTVDKWVGRLLLFVVLTLFVNGLWGQAGRLLPEPFSDWYQVPYQLFGSWWFEHAPHRLSTGEQMSLFHLLVAYLLAMAVPLLVLRLAANITASRAGLGKARREGLSATALGAAIMMPLGFWFAVTAPTALNSPLREVVQFLSIIPEHFLVFGVIGVLLLPGQRLVWPSLSAGGFGVGLFAIIAASLNFGLLHVGTPHFPELLTAFPLGLLFAAMTYVTGSVWPAIGAHAVLQLIPLVLSPLLR